MKRPILTTISIIIVIFGFSLLAYGLYLSWGEPAEQLQMKIEEYEIGNGTIPLSMTPNFDSLTIAPASNIELLFDKNVIFEGDSVKVQAIAKDVKENVIVISFVLNDGSWSFAGKTGYEVEYERQRALNANRLIELLHNSEPPFTTEKTIKFLNPNEDIHLVGVYLLNNKTYVNLNTEGKMFTVYPQIDKLQADTNLALLKQIEQTKISNIQQERMNQLFAGLSIIGIALVPILGGFDLLLRIHLK